MRPSALGRGFALGILRDLLEFCGKLVPGKHSRPRGRGVQFRIGAVLQHSNTPSLRVAGFEDEDDDEDENEAPPACSTTQKSVVMRYGSESILPCLILPKLP